MSLKIKYEYINFVEIDTKPKTKIYSCRKNGTEIELGIVKWFGPWRQYCLYTIDDVILNKGCLADIEDFIGQLKKR